jgi:hypothetical protein
MHVAFGFNPQYWGKEKDKKVSHDLGGMKIF